MKHTVSIVLVGFALLCSSGSTAADTQSEVKFIGRPEINCTSTDVTGKWRIHAPGKDLKNHFSYGSELDILRVGGIKDLDFFELTSIDNSDPKEATSFSRYSWFGFCEESDDSPRYKLIGKMDKKYGELICTHQIMILRVENGKGEPDSDPNNSKPAHQIKIHSTTKHNPTAVSCSEHNKSPDHHESSQNELRAHHAGAAHGGND